MLLSVVTERASTIEGVEAAPYKAAGQALEVIPRTLAQNCGANVIRTLTKLRAKHAETPVGQPCPFGINGETGVNTASSFFAQLMCVFTMSSACKIVGYGQVLLQLQSTLGHD